MQNSTEYTPREPGSTDQALRGDFFDPCGPTCSDSADYPALILLTLIRWRKDATFDGRHDLLRLFKESGILRLDEELLESKGVDPIQLRTTVVAFRAAMNTIVLLWANDYRFASERQLRGRLVNMGLHEGKKGDPLKANALALLNAAQKIVDEGVVLWTSKKE